MQQWLRLVQHGKDGWGLCWLGMPILRRRRRRRQRWRWDGTDGTDGRDGTDERRRRRQRRRHSRRRQRRKRRARNHKWVSQCWAADPRVERVFLGLGRTYLMTSADVIDVFSLQQWLSICSRTLAIPCGGCSWRRWTCERARCLLPGC